MRLEVSLHGRVVGHVTKEAEPARFSFTLNEDYFRDRNRDVLGQSFEERRQHQVFRSNKLAPEGLPTFFANLLPEGALLRIVEAQRTGELDDAETLALLGEDLPGAAVVRLVENDAASHVHVGGYDEPLHGAFETSELRFSLAGVQLKFSAVRDANDRFVLPFRGRGGRWILKFGSTEYPFLPENEHSTMEWGARSGIQMPRRELVRASEIQGLAPELENLGEHVFAIQRYDREADGTRVHQEDVAQVLGLLPLRKYSGISYEKLALLVADLAGEEDARELLRRVWFSILCGNTDAHTKNWSLVYPDKRSARLSPAYDLVFVRHYLPNDGLALTLIKEKNPAAISWDHARRIERYLHEQGRNVPVVRDARELVTRALDVWATTRTDVAPEYAAAMDAYHATLDLVRGLR